MTRREYAEQQINYYRQLAMYAPRNTTAEQAYRKNLRHWQSFLKFHDYMQKGTE